MTLREHDKDPSDPSGQNLDNVSKIIEIMSNYFIFRAITLVIIGLDDAGKTTMVASLQGGKYITQMSTN